MCFWISCAHGGPSRPRTYDIANSRHGIAAGMARSTARRRAGHSIGRERSAFPTSRDRRDRVFAAPLCPHSALPCAVALRRPHAEARMGRAGVSSWLRRPVASHSRGAGPCRRDARASPRRASRGMIGYGLTVMPSRSGRSAVIAHPPNVSLTANHNSLRPRLNGSASSSNSPTMPRNSGSRVPKPELPEKSSAPVEEDPHAVAVAEADAHGAVAVRRSP